MRYGGGGGGGLPDPKIRGSPVFKSFFRPFGPPFGLKAREGRVPWAPPLDPPLRKMIFQSVTQAAQKKGQVFSRSRTDDLGYFHARTRRSLKRKQKFYELAETN